MSIRAARNTRGEEAMAQKGVGKSQIPETRTFRVGAGDARARVGTHWLVKSDPATSTVLTSPMVRVSGSDRAIERVPAPSAVRSRRQRVERYIRLAVGFGFRIFVEFLPRTGR